MKLLLIIILFYFSNSVFSLGNNDVNFNKAKTYYQNGDIESALSLLQNILRTQPPHQKSLELLAQIFFQQGKYQRAVKVYRILIKNYYSSKILSIRNKSELENFLEKTKQQNSFPNIRIRSYFKNIYQILSKFLQKSRDNLSLVEIEKVENSIKLFIEIYQRLSQKNSSIEDFQSELEKEALDQFSKKQYSKSLVNYRKLYHQFGDSQIFEINSYQELKSYLEQSQNPEKRSLIYLIKMAQNYHYYGKQESLGKEKRARVDWLRNKYLISYKYFKGEYDLKRLTERKKQASLESEDLLSDDEDLPDEDGDLPDEDGDLPEDDDLPSFDSKEISKTKVESQKIRYTLLAGYSLWQEKLKLKTSSGAISDKDFVVRGPCFGGGIVKKKSILDFTLEACLFLGNANIGSSSESNENVFVKGIFSNAGILLEIIPKSSFGIELGIMAREASFTNNSSDELEGKTSVSTLVNLVMRWKEDKWWITQKIGKSTGTESIWSFNFNWVL